MRWLVAIGLVAAAIAGVGLLRIEGPSESRASRGPVDPAAGVAGGQAALPLRADGAAAAPALHAARAVAAPSPLAKARRAYRALRLHFSAGNGLLLKYAGEHEYAGVWAAGQAMNGAVDLARLPHGALYDGQIKRMFDGMRFYWDGSGSPAYDKVVRAPFGSGGYKFYDDNVLVALTLVRAYGVTHDRAMLVRAERIFAFEKFGWDRNPADPFPGGVFWTQSPRSQNRNTVTTAGSAELALRLYQLTGRKTYLHWGKRMYAWVERTLRAPSGLYWDHVDPQGVIHKGRYSYNQGLMLGASQLLYRATGHRSYLRQAERTARAALAFYRNRFATQRPIFDAIFFRNLLALDNLRPKPAYRKAVAAYARLLNHQVNHLTDLLPLEHAPLILDQATLVQLNAFVASLRHRIPVG